jgi:hypothetical protein
MDDRKRRRLRRACLAWMAAFFLAWLSMTVAVLVRQARAEPSASVWYRTGALLAAWAGFFAWKALERPAQGK